MHICTSAHQIVLLQSITISCTHPFHIRLYQSSSSSIQTGCNNNITNLLHPPLATQTCATPNSRSSNLCHAQRLPLRPVECPRLATETCGMPTSRHSDLWYAHLPPLRPVLCPLLATQTCGMPTSRHSDLCCAHDSPPRTAPHQLPAPGPSCVTSFDVLCVMRLSCDNDKSC